MTPAITNRDGGDECDRCDQLAFEVPRQPVCAACGAREKHWCGYDAALYTGAPPGRRPNACLHRWDPATAPWPPGFGEAA